MKKKQDVAPDEERLKTILNSMVESVFVTDAKGKVVLTNAALDALSAEDVLGRRAKHVIDNKELRTAIRRARKRDQAAEVEIEANLGGRDRIMQAQVSPLPGGKGVVTVLHDVTRLREADRIRRDFVANASHELRTPLTAIRAFAETLQDGALGDPEVARRFVDRIVLQTLRLQSLVEDLTRLSSAESPSPDDDFETTDLRLLVSQNVAPLEAAAVEKSIPLQIELPEVPVVADVSPSAIEHILSNLVENAIKYSPPRTPVFVSLQTESGYAVMEVRDQGRGISPKYHERIFERFYRVDKGRSRDEGGTGLGLSIVKNLVERIQGRIELQSAPGEGSRFRIFIPIASADDDSPA